MVSTISLKDYNFKLRHISEDLALCSGLYGSLKLLNLYFNIFFSQCRLYFFKDFHLSRKAKNGETSQLVLKTYFLVGSRESEWNGENEIKF